jgi:hypothetical protein
MPWTLADQLWYALQAVEGREYLRLAAQQYASKPSEPWTRAAGIANDRAAITARLVPNFAKQVFFQQSRSCHGSSGQNAELSLAWRR